MSLFLDRYVDYASEFCDAPKVFHRYVGFSVLATVLGRKIWLQKGDTNFFPNLWILLISPSSKFHRSTAIRIGRNLLSQLEFCNIYPNEFSREGFLSMFQNQSEGFLRIDEFGGFLKYMEKDYMSGFKELITELYESPDYFRRKLAGREIELKNICINILAGSSLKWIQNSLKEEDMLGGFLPRFLLIPASQKEKIIPFQPPYSREKQFQLLSTLTQLYKIQGEVNFEFVKNEYAEWYCDYQKSFTSELFDPFCIRLLDYCLKFAMLFQIDIDGSLVVSSQAMGKAIEEIENITSDMLSISSNLYSTRSFGEKKKQILHFITTSEGVSRTDILNRFDISAKELTSIMDTLLQAELVIAEKISTQSKPKIVYKRRLP